jgi:Domain of unknown function (DUF4956)
MINDLFGTDTIFDPEDFSKLFCRLGMNLAFASVVILVVYYRRYKNREFVFTYYVFNVITFSMCILLRKTPMDMGFALGLFAIFGILKYRTEQIRMRDLTYLFIVLGLAILNAVANKKVSLLELVAVDLVITLVVVVVELRPRSGRVETSSLLYDRLELLRPGQRAALHADLGARLGLQVTRVQVHRIDLLKDAAEVTVTYVDCESPRVDSSGSHG